EFMRLTREVGYPIRHRHSRCVAYWATEVGELNQAVHLWEYDDFAHRTRVRAALAADSEWQEKFLPAIRPCLLHQVSAVLIPSDVWPFTPASHGIYELRYYKLLPGRVGEWLAKFRTGLAARAKYGNTPVGVWTAELGSLNMVYHLWGYADLQDRADVRKTFADDPVWTEVVRTASPLMLEMNTKILIATDFSPLR
ncbi:MAG TPA: NIPSNAP family protein, partial [Candidatus Limnocylindrales bacterium]|nr:NIPSNAP family protein [Candidatus Limnocylindrales bacterium]